MGIESEIMSEKTLNMFPPSHNSDITVDVQVSVHLKNESECYECVERPKPKGYPVCTIRNTPDKPIHCVVWAKDLLFARLFGPPEAVTDLDEVANDDAEAGEAGTV